jgi:hypothetical protein
VEGAGEVLFPNELLRWGRGLSARDAVADQKEFLRISFAKQWKALVTLAELLLAPRSDAALIQKTNSPLGWRAPLTPPLSLLRSMLGVAGPASDKEPAIGGEECLKRQMWLWLFSVHEKYCFAGVNRLYF